MNNVVQKQPNPSASIKGLLEQMKGQIQAALPTHLTAERMIRICLTSINSTPKLLECTQQSLLKCIMQSAQTGIEPDGRLAYLIPYGKECTYIIGYKGLMQLARNSGEVKAFFAEAVCRNDVFKRTLHLDPPFVFEPALENRGDVMGYVAIARLSDGSVQHEYMTVSEIDEIKKKYAKGWERSDSPWRTSLDGQSRKTVIRRLSKYLPLSAQKAMYPIDEEGNTIDGEYSVMNFNEAPQEEQPKKSAMDALLEKEEPVVIEQPIGQEATETPSEEQIESIRVGLLKAESVADVDKIMRENGKIFLWLSDNNMPKFNIINGLATKRLQELAPKDGDN